jgi:hypothetical protein
LQLSIRLSRLRVVESEFGRNSLQVVWHSREQK